MSLAHFRSCLIAAVLLLGCAASHADQNTAASLPAPFVITLRVTNVLGKDYFDLNNPSSSFDVTIKNVSAKPEAIWSDHCSWGYGIVSLRVMAINGKPFVVPVSIEPAPRAWSANAPVSDILVSGAEIVRHVLVSELPSRSFAVRAPLSSSQAQSGRFKFVKAVAVLNTLSMGNTAKFNAQQRVWSGKIVSAPITFKTVI